jgi:hypothetical protein
MYSSVIGWDQVWLGLRLAVCKAHTTVVKRKGGNPRKDSALTSFWFGYSVTGWERKTCLSVLRTNLRAKGFILRGLQLKGLQQPHFQPPGPLPVLL